MKIRFGLLALMMAVAPLAEIRSEATMEFPALDVRMPPGVTVLEKRPAYSFNLMPKSMQKEPLLDIFFITEFTNEGRRRSMEDPEPTVRYISETGEYLKLGLGSSHPPARMVRDAVHDLLENALAASGFSRVDHNVTTPELLIIINWGIHLPPDYFYREHFIPQEQRQDFLERLALVGGEDWARAMGAKLKAYDWEEAEEPWNLAVWSMPINLRYHDYLARIVDDVRDPRVSRLLVACHEGVYFATASAYDYVTFAQGERTLLWRTKMAVPVSGVNMTETLPQLALSAIPYFGRETGGPLEVPIRITRGTTVTIGASEVIELDAQIPAQPESEATEPDQ